MHSSDGVRLLQMAASAWKITWDIIVSTRSFWELSSLAETLLQLPPFPHPSPGCLWRPRLRARLPGWRVGRWRRRVVCFEDGNGDVCLSFGSLTYLGFWSFLWSYLPFFVSISPPPPTQIPELVYLFLFGMAVLESDNERERETDSRSVSQSGDPEETFVFSVITCQKLLFRWG